MFLRSVLEPVSLKEMTTQGSAQVNLEQVTGSLTSSKMLTNSDGEVNFFFVHSNVRAGESFCLTMGFLFS